MNIEERKIFRKIESFSGLESKREKEPPKGLGSLKEKITDLIENYSAKKFSKAKKRKTEKVKIPEAEMFQYPSKDFRELDWFKNLPEDKKKETETEIAQRIHSETLKNLDKHYGKFFKKLAPEVRQFFEKNREIKKDSKIPKEEKANFFREQSKKLSAQEKEGILKAIGDFEEKFGQLPGDTDTLEANCTSHTTFVGKIFEYYDFQVRPIHMPDYISLMLKAGGKSYVSDVDSEELIPIRDYREKMKKLVYREIESVSYGGSGSYESIVHFNFGNLLKDFGKFPEAESQYREAIRLEPNNVMAHNNFGILLYKLEKFPQAEKEYREALKINPDLTEAHLNLAILYLAMGQLAKAKGEAREGIKLHRAQGRNEKAERLEKIMIRELGIDEWSKDSDANFKKEDKIQRTGL
ncbi:tetratricopeptide repeat protein [Patescibacteria group bacterium]|nr:tetratricopeptide repeat protein [Patescibacteria group bacterium]MBU4481814.1 tetratricopeptide repeat protein [Patescibacteria group bacterium]